MIRLLGELKFRTSYGQNVLMHSTEMAHMAGLIAEEIGADVRIAKTATRLAMDRCQWFPPLDTQRGAGHGTMVREFAQSQSAAIRLQSPHGL